MEELGFRESDDGWYVSSGRIARPDGDDSDPADVLWEWLANRIDGIVSSGVLDARLR